MNAKSGKVAHEIVTDGSVYFGANTDPGNTDESVKFPSAVALVWRWSGDNRFLNRLYDFSRRAMRYVVDNLDADKDGWPEGLGNVEREGMGGEKLDNTVYLIRGLTDLADMAVLKRDQADGRWARKLAASACAPRSTRPGGTPRRASTPTRWATTTRSSSSSTGSASRRWRPGSPPRAPRRTRRSTCARRDCFSGSSPFNRGLFHTGCTGGPEGKGEKIVFSLNTAIKAVADGEYGRASQRRYTDANAVGVLDEQPGALPEILPSPDQNRNIDRCWTCRSMFMQAWGHYGTAWPVIAQQLGVRPDARAAQPHVVPNIPEGQERIAGNSIRIGDEGAVAVRALRDDDIYETRVTLRSDDVRGLRIGVTVPRGTKAGTVRLDGRRVRHDADHDQRRHRGHRARAQAARPPRRDGRDLRRNLKGPGPFRFASGLWLRGARVRPRFRPPWPGRAARRCRARASPSGRGRASRGRRWTRCPGR